MEEDSSPNPIEQASPPGEEVGTMRRVSLHARRHARRVWDHLWGPTGSVILHLFILYALIHWVSFSGREFSDQIEVMVVDPETVDLEDIQRELEQLPDLEVDIALPEMAITMDVPTDVVRPVEPTTRDDLAALDIRSEVDSALVMRGLIAGRSEGGRAALLRRFAGRRAQATEMAVLRALEWLKEHQLDDGSWVGSSRASNKTGMTGLGLLAFLAHGQVPTSERYGPTVERAVRFLIADMDRTPEAHSARMGTRAYDVGSYSHGIATYALAEAYALTRIPSIQPVLERALLRIIAGQQASGGFSYGIQKNQTRRDTSLMSWMAQAMKAAYISGVTIPGLEAAMENTAAAFKLNLAQSGDLFAYAPGAADPNERPARGTPHNTAQAVLALQLIGHGASPEARGGAQAIAGRPCVWFEPTAGSYTLYNWYYHTQAMFHQGGQAWETWNRQFSPAYLGGQNADGSWTPFHEWERMYGPVYGTAFGVLTLTVYYRFLPTYQPIAIDAPATQESEDDVTVEIL